MRGREGGGRRGSNINKEMKFDEEWTKQQRHCALREHAGAHGMDGCGYRHSPDLQGLQCSLLHLWA